MILWSFKQMSPCPGRVYNIFLTENLYFFDRPAQVKWQLMIASCYRRSGNYQQALETYKKIHKRFPDNIECKCRLGMWYKNIIHVLFMWFLITSYFIYCVIFSVSIYLTKFNYGFISACIVFLHRLLKMCYTKFISTVLVLLCRFTLLNEDLFRSWFTWSSRVRHEIKESGENQGA